MEESTSVTVIVVSTAVGGSFSVYVSVPPAVMIGASLTGVTTIVTRATFESAAPSFAL